ncbi:ATP-grasp domain-containing protein [Streptomyces sp. NPDC054796]
MTCAIVDAYGAGRLLPAALRRYGVEFLHVRSEFPDTYLEYRPEDFSVDIAHKGDVAATAAELRRHGVDHVVAAAESGVLLANELSVALGTPGNGMRRPEARRNKLQMQRAVRDAGLASADSLVSASADEVVAWAVDRGEWPVILKPVASAGTDNVLICDSADDVRAAHARILSGTDRYGRGNGTVLAQRFLVGEEHYVNTVSRNGVHRIVEIWHYFKRPVPGGRSINDYEILLPPDDPEARQIGDYALAVLDALEIRNGAAHTEVMLTKDGPVLIECGARLGGGQMPDVLSRCIGTDQVDRLAFSIAHPEEFSGGSQEPYRPRTHLRCVNLISPHDGTVPSGARWDPVRALPSFAALVPNLPEGGPAPRTVDLATCPGAVYLSSHDAAQVEADCARLRELERDGLYDG